MWKWTDSDHIKAIILDGNTLDDEYLDYPYRNIISDVHIFLINKSPRITYDGIHELIYIDTSLLLQEVLTTANCQSYSVIAISANIAFIKEMMQNHIGTIFAKNISESHLKNLPDFSIDSIDKLIKILEGNILGYAAEAFAIDCNFLKTKILLQIKTEIILDNLEKKDITLYFGGRYYAKKYGYILDDPLSVVLLNFKSRHLPAVELFYDQAIAFIHDFENFDVLTYVPLKPQEIIDGKFDRFASLTLNQSKQKNIHLDSIIKCTKDFTQKEISNIHTRQENVKDAYEVISNVENKNVLILDDLYTSGSTIKEIAKTLYKHGANHVSALLLAVNQTIESMSTLYKKIPCLVCHDYLDLKINKKNNLLFFGCRSYDDHQNQNSSDSCIQGIRKLKKINKLEIRNINDLEDEY